MKPTLTTRLDAHFTTPRSWSMDGALKRAAGNWQLYAAVTGSALAMVSNASAGVIYHAGPVTSPAPNLVTSGGTGRVSASANIRLKTMGGGNEGSGFSFGAFQLAANFKSFTGSAFLKNTAAMGFLATIHNGSVKVDKLAAGVLISAHSPFITPEWEGAVVPLAKTCVGSGCIFNNSGWAPSQFGFAAFQFNTAGHGTDYGWIQLEYTQGQNGLADGVTVKDWAYDNTGAAIETGQSAGTPEPSTSALMLLAGGAAGVTALRRRRKLAA